MKYDKNSQISKQLIADISKFVKAFYFGCKVKAQKPEKLSQIRKSGKVKVFNQEGEEIDALAIEDDTVDDTN